MILLETVYGHKMYLPAGKIPYQEDAIKKYGIYEPATSAAVFRFVKPGMHVVEAGACCGYHALNIAKAIGSGGKLTCFEANPNLIAFLTKNLEINGYAGYSDVYNTGLWMSDGVLPFPLLEWGLGGASFKNPRQLASVPTAQVKTVSLDSFFGDRPVDFIRMDIEGAELEALKGARNMLSSQGPAMILEWIPDNVHTEESVELYNLLKAFGYHIYRITRDGLKEITRDEDLYSKFVEEHERDILCCRESVN